MLDAMLGLLVDFLVLEDIIEDVLPSLGLHMRSLNIDVNMILAAPLMSLFVGHLPSITALRFFDVFLLYGRQVLLAGMVRAVRCYCNR